MTGRTQEAGFSLIEILVATAVFAVVGVTSVSLLATTITAQDVNEAALDRINALDRVRVLLREDMGQVVQRPVRALAQVVIITREQRHPHRLRPGGS